jgi:hypothetical protein
LALIFGRLTCGALICVVPTLKELISVVLSFLVLICAEPTSRMLSSQALTFEGQIFEMLL